MNSENINEKPKLSDLNLPEDILKFYQEIEDLNNFRRQQKQMTIDLQKQQEWDKITNKKPEKIEKFLGKLKKADKNYQEKVQEALLKEVQQLNFQSHIPELIAQITDCQMQSNYVKYYVELCNNLSKIYAEQGFTEKLLTQIKKIVEILDTKQGQFANETERARKRMNLSRFLGELYLSGVIKSDQQNNFLECIKQLIMPDTTKGQDVSKSEKAKDKEALENYLLNLKVGVSFLNTFANDLFNTYTYQQRQLFQQYPDLKEMVFELEKQENKNTSQKLYTFFTQVYIPKIKHTLKQIYQKVEEVQQQKITEFGEDTTLRELKENFTKIKDGMKSVYDSLGLYDPENNQDEDKIFDFQKKDFEEFESQIEGEPFDTDFDKQLYQQVPDLRELVPKEILKREKDALARAQLTGGRDETQLTDAFFKKFRDCTNIEIADELAVDFCYINTKKNRKILIEELTIYKSNYLLVVTFQCRLVGTLSRVFKELEEESSKIIMESYKSIKISDQHAFDKKQRFIRYICELTKFKVMRQDIIMEIFQGLLEDFINQNIELSILILENVGKFLLRSLQSYRKFKFQIEQLTKLRGSKPIQQQLDIQLENALNSMTNSNSYLQKPQTNKSNLQKYIRFLLLEKLSEKTFEQIRMDLLKLPFKNAECHHFLYKYLIKLSIKGRFSQMDLVAGIIASLRPFYPILTGQIVDHILEEIEMGLEDNQFNLRQKRLTFVKFFGEFYNFSIIQRDLLFNVLYQLIEYGHDSDIQKHLQDIIDPPDDTFRITQVLFLLDTVRDYYKKLKNPLVRFLAFFQRYTLSKSYIPQTVEFNILDVYELIDPNLKNIRTMKQAESFCQKIIEMEQTQQNVNYEEELKKMFGQTQPDQSIDLNGKRRQEELQKAQAQQQQIEQELEQQYKKLMNEVQYEAKQKKIQPQTQKKGVVVKPLVKGKVIQRTVEVSEKDQNAKKKLLKINQSLGLFQMTNFNIADK